MGNRRNNPPADQHGINKWRMHCVDCGEKRAGGHGAVVYGSDSPHAVGRDRMVVSHWATTDAQLDVIAERKQAGRERRANRNLSADQFAVEPTPTSTGTGGQSRAEAAAQRRADRIRDRLG